MSVRKEVEERPIENSPTLQIGNMAEEYQSIFDEQITIFQTESAKVKENFDKQLKPCAREGIMLENAPLATMMLMQMMLMAKLMFFHCFI